ncbi:MAG: PKD domain-containing protein [Thermoplasmata archaeon]|nr:PKD domain-containing protein [Thermoplasmata archaeon]
MGIAAASGSRWFNLTSQLNPSPVGRFAGQMAYDTKDGYAVFFSGANNSSTVFDDTWTYQHGNWTQLFPSVSPQARIAAMFVYDPIDQYLVLYGGVDPSGGNFFQDTWTFSGGVWTNITTSVAPPARAEAGAAWDPVDQSLVLFGGTNSSVTLGDTWRFVGGTWTELFPSSSPSARVLPVLAFDAADNYLILFGGVIIGTNYADTWRFTNGTWTELFPATAPSGRATFAATYDPQTASVILFGGGVGNDSLFFGDTWSFRGGGWTQLFPVASPAARQFSLMVWDSADGYLFLFGGASAYVTYPQVLGESWAFATPPTVSFVPTAPIDTGQSVPFAATITGGVPPYHVNWTFGDGGSATGSAPSHPYGNVGTYQVNLTVRDRFGETVNTNHTVTIGDRPAVSLTASPTSVLVGEPTNLTDTVSGGAAPLTFAWTLGDGRTHSGPGPISISYSSAGRFNVSVSVTDAAGVTTVANTSVTVHAMPPPSTSSSPGPWLGGYSWLVVLGLIVAAGVVGTALVLRRRRPGSGPPASSAPPVATQGPPPPTPPT